jgi:hypothetical protein
VSWHDREHILKFLSRLRELRSLKLSGFLPNFTPTEIPSALAGLTNFESFSLRCDMPIAWKISLIAALAENCPRLQEMDIAISVSDLPPFSSGVVMSHSLGKIIVHSSDRVVDTVAVARHLDRLFPRLNSVRYDTSSGEGSEVEASWAQVQELVFAFQDVRRNAWAQRGIHARSINLKRIGILDGL